MVPFATILAVARFGQILRPKLGFVAMNLGGGKNNMRQSLSSTWPLATASNVTHSFQCCIHLILKAFSFRRVSIQLRQCWTASFKLVNSILQVGSAGAPNIFISIVSWISCIQHGIISIIPYFRMHYPHSSPRFTFPTPS